MFPLSPVDFAVRKELFFFFFFRKELFNGFLTQPTKKDLRRAQGKNSAKVNALIGALRAGKAEIGQESG